IHAPRITLEFRMVIPYVSASTLAQRGTNGYRCYIRTTKKKRANTGQTVCAQARPVSIVIEFVALKETTAGSSLASNRSGQAMEPYCCGLGRLWILKNSCARRRRCAKANEVHVQQLTGSTVSLGSWPRTVKSRPSIAHSSSILTDRWKS